MTIANDHGLTRLVHLCTLSTMPEIWEKVAAENIVRHRSGTYYLQATVGGKKVPRRSLKTKDLRIAKMRRDAELAKYRAVVPGAVDAIKTVGDAFAIVEAGETQKPNIKPRTRGYYVELCRVMKQSLPLSRGLHALTDVDALAWWKSTEAKTARINGKPRSESQRNNMLRLALMVGELAVKAGHLQKNPFSSLSRLKLKKTAVDRLPSRAQFQLILGNVREQGDDASGQNADLIEFLATTGMRKGEAQFAEWEDDLGQWFRIHGGVDGTKNGETRLLPVSPRLRALLDRLRPPDASGRIFTLKEPGPVLRRACERLRKAGNAIMHMRVHDLRHYFATTCIEAGIDIPTVAKWLGHKDGGVLAMKTYGHLRDEHSLASAQKLV